MITEFQSKVYKLCKQVPKGKITTYKAIANKLNTKAYRAVGSALNKNPYRHVPCHRVVNADAYVGGFARGMERKIDLLKKEGVFVKDSKVIDFDERLSTW
jgi:methylated-DNA-[protein]-cysteine S-methyltransferase